MNNSACWFHDHGVPVFPTVNKVPAVKKGTSQFDYRCSREQAARFKEYGVPLGLFAVADSDSQISEAWNASHLPDTPFKVTTGPYHDGSPGNGRHRWYRLIGDVPHFFHRDGLTIEFRHRGQYVVGPGSVRPDGVMYRADSWSWNIDDVPFFPADCLFDDRQPQVGTGATGTRFTFPDRVAGGERHAVLFQFLRSLKAKGNDYDGTHEIVLLANEHRCHPPLVVKDARGEPDATFEKWFNRAWNNRDRPFTRAAAPEIPDQPLEPHTPTADYDLETGGEI